MKAEHDCARRIKPHDDGVKARAVASCCPVDERSCTPERIVRRLDVTSGSGRLAKLQLELSHRRAVVPLATKRWPDRGCETLNALSGDCPAAWCKATPNHSASPPENRSATRHLFFPS